MAAEAGKKQEIVFLLEVVGCRGLPKPELTAVQLLGFGLPGPVTSLPREEESTEPAGWLFHDLEALRALEERKRLEEEAAQAAKATKGKKPKDAPAADAGPEIEMPPPEPLCRIAQACGSSAERQRLLDAVCTPLRVSLMRSSDSPVELGTASLEVQELIHDTASIDVSVDLVWSDSFKQELRQEFDDQQAAALAADAAARGEEAEEGADAAPAAEQNLTPFKEPRVGQVTLRISTAAPIGRALCPEDLKDWAVVTVRVDGCFRLPEKLQELGAPGATGEQPLQYSLRALGCSFEGGAVVVPEVPVAETTEEAATGSADGELGAAGESTATRLATPEFSCDIGQEEFVEGLMRAGFATASEDGPAIFSYLSRPRTGLDGKIGKAEFERIEEYEVPASAAQLLQLHSFLLEQKGSLEEAFNALDKGSDGFLTKELLKEGLESLGFPGLEDADALFLAFDAQDTDEITLSDVQLLELFSNLATMEVAEKVKRWLLECCGTTENLRQQLDECRTGAISSEQWKSAMARLGYPEVEETTFVFQLLDASCAGEIAPSAVDLLEQIDMEAFQKALSKFEELLSGPDGPPGDAIPAFARLKGSITSDSLALNEFRAACGELRADLGVDPQLLFVLLKGSCAGCFGKDDLIRLFSYNTGNRKRKIAACKVFVKDNFESAKGAFKTLFDDHSEVYNDAEEMQARIEWPNPEARGYRGRAWMQQLLNTLRDDRGRNLQDTSAEVAAAPGSWLYMFPKLTGQSLVDFKELTDANQSSLGRMARWHHSQAFLDLRRLAAPGNSDSAGPCFEFRAFLLQVDNQPKGITEAGELPTPAYSASHTYIKGTISLNRPLARLCPRNIQPLPSLGGNQCIIPPAPEKKPPPTVIEDLEYEARRIVGKLAGEFARMCREGELEEPQVVGPNGQIGPHVLLGRTGVMAHRFVEWVKEQDGGALYRDLSSELRPAIVRWVRSEAKDGPACGFNGQEQDSMYSGIRDMILQHLFRALNHDVELHQRKRDARLWRAPAVLGGADSHDPNFGKPAELIAKDLRDDKTLKRLLFEYELLGETKRATELFDELLALPHNKENAAVWCSYARFLMRCGQRQPEAMEALRYTISLKSPDSGPSIEEAAFLACMLQNHRSRITLDGAEPTPTMRYEAARAVLETYVDTHPTEQLPMYMLFVVHALEAHGLQAEMDQGDAPGAADQALVARMTNIRAEAMKYLELARATPQICYGNLNTQKFPELQALTRTERLARGELSQVPQVATTPAAWEPPEQPVFPSFDSVHRLPEADDLVALKLIDLMLHFGAPSFVHFLIQDASEAYGFLSPATVDSEQCRMQLIRAAMLSEDWDLAIEHANRFVEVGDRLRKIHVLLGECHFRRARSLGVQDASAYGDALRAFDNALSFLPEGAATDAPDPVLHLRVATILYLQAQEGGFADSETMAKAVMHYKKSLQVVRTAEAWRCAGVCCYRQARLLPRRLDEPSQAKQRQNLLRDALHFFKEANRMDGARPQINAWLVMCSVELGLVQVAKQTLRQVLRHADRLDFDTASELAQLLLRFSNERLAEPGERWAIVQDGRYAQEAAAVARIALSCGESEEVRNVLERALAMTGKSQN